MVDSKLRDTIKDAITMFGGDNGKPNLLVISHRDAKGDLKNTLDDAVVSVIVVAVQGFNHDSSKITCLVDNKDKQLIYKPDAASIQMRDFKYPDGGKPDFNQHTGCSISHEQSNSTVDLSFTRRLQWCLSDYFKKNGNNNDTKVLSAGYCPLQNYKHWNRDFLCYLIL